jgi:hypothetical protein
MVMSFPFLLPFCTAVHDADHGALPAPSGPVASPPRCFGDRQVHTEKGADMAKFDSDARNGLILLLVLCAGMGVIATLFLYRP